MAGHFVIAILRVSIIVTFFLSGHTVMANTPLLGMGAKSGEVTSTSAHISLRLTKSLGQALNHSVPGQLGKARIHYSLSPNMQSAQLSSWQSSAAENDYYLQYKLTELQANTRYYYAAELASTEGKGSHMSAVFSFKTAPAHNQRENINFQVTTCQSAQGLPVYPVMQRQNPDFLVSAGDTVYYDKFDVRSKEDAYWLYQKEYGTPYTINYFANTSAYFMKDDHDYRYNDADPYSNVEINTKNYVWGPNGLNSNLDRSDKTWLTHEEGIEVFKQVFPSSDLPYRSFRWGKGIQIWLLEGRDYRSANKEPDSPQKSIWGKQQTAWLKQTLLSSDADFRIIVSPSPLIGPDKPHKRDNHANVNGFMIEGRSFMDWMIENNLVENTFLVCGDRHWQYHSIYKDKVHEFCSGPTSQFQVQYVPKPTAGVIKQPYNGPTGGFLTVKYDTEKTVSFEHYGETGKLLNKKTFSH